MKFYFALKVYELLSAEGEQSQGQASQMQGTPSSALGVHCGLLCASAVGSRTETLTSAPNLLSASLFPAGHFCRIPSVVDEDY